MSAQDVVVSPCSEELPVSPTPAQPPQEPYPVCERCGNEHDGADDVCEECLEAIDDDEDEPDQPVLNDGISVIHGTTSGTTSRRTWAAKEPHKPKKRVLYQGDEDMFSLSESEERDSVDDDTPDLLGYLGDFPGLTPITKISMLRAAANYLSSQQRATKPFLSPAVPAAPKKAKKGKVFVTKKKRSINFEA